MGVNAKSSATQFSLGAKLEQGSELSSLLCLLCQQPLIEPRQCSCGDRLCSICYNSLLASSTEKFQCQRCNSESLTKECFRDKAVDSDLKRAVFPCLHPSCPWSGSAVNYREHVKVCKYAPVHCSSAGCGFVGTQSELTSHLASCPALPVKCKWCQESVPRNALTEHVSSSCSGALIQCIAGCGAQLLRGELSDHLQKICPKQKRPCTYSQFGCPFEGDLEELRTHDKESTSQHLELVSHAFHSKRDLESSECVPAIGTSGMQKHKQATDRQIIAIHGELSRLAEEVGIQIAPLREGIMKLESSLVELQEGFSELALMAQALQATSYNGEFIWKIPEVARRTKEAQMGKTISLYSAPFYTSRFGYKMCLRLYLNGDGAGKGTHLSFFLTIMRGEYDALLSWPFQQMVTLILLDQDRRKNIVQAFRPEPSSSSFWQPKTEMNIASGCPKFAPLSVLNHPSYVRNDTLYLKVIVDKTALSQP